MCTGDVGEPHGVFGGVDAPVGCTAQTSAQRPTPGLLPDELGGVCEETPTTKTRANKPSGEHEKEDIL